MPEVPRDYLAEAHAILEGATMLLPERAHLEALAQEYRSSQERIVKLTLGTSRILESLCAKGGD